MFRRSNPFVNFSALLVLAGCFLVSTVALATDKPKECIKLEKTDEKVIITKINDEGQTETQVFDLSGLGDMIDEALSSLETTQFQLRLGEDNMLSLAMDDTAMEIDLDVILSQVGAAISNGLEEFNSSEWATNGPRNESGLADDDQEAEMAKLRAEMRSLKRELKKLKSD